jgi:hypothetical protein
MRSAVLFLVFNRPETTGRVFEAIRAARPPRLYVAADGPRPGRPTEEEACRLVRQVATQVDWPCEVKTLFRERNLGCRKAVSNALAWFFEEEPEGIILEDDVLPAPTFFEYCDELLERYRDDERVSMIAGCNLVAEELDVDQSYLFSNYCNIWGWATWRRMFAHYDVAIADWPSFRDRGGLLQISGGNALFAGYWSRIFDAVHAGRIDTWDYQWTFACWSRGGLTVLPAVNQIENLGFGAGATHTRAEAPGFIVRLRARPLATPLTHPAVVAVNKKADSTIGARVFGISLAATLMRPLLDIPLLGAAIRSAKAAFKSAAR